MEIKSFTQYVEATVVLKENIDFTQEQMERDMLCGGRLLMLSSAARIKCAQDHGFDECTNSGYYSAEHGTVEAVMRKNVTGMSDKLAYQPWCKSIERKNQTS